METEKKVRRPRIDTDNFVKVWVAVANRGGSVSDVASEVGCSVAGAMTKRKKLCEEGAELPPLAGERKKPDISSINDYIKANLKV